MQKVIAINLNGNAYQLEESGYEALRAYLDVADARLAGNPDKSEIMADLEQAVAEKCHRFLSRGKTVVTAAEVDQMLGEIGPVDSGHTAAEAAHAARERPANEAPPKRLYQIREGAWISGVCNGIAAYVSVDATVVRIAFVLLALVKGAGVLLYILLMFMVPYAKTSEQLAAAQGPWPGLPYRVSELVERWKRKVSEMSGWTKKAL
jgi:phage shock protein PspC (stress-responsive transcriptional regulator)